MCCFNRSQGSVRNRETRKKAMLQISAHPNTLAIIEAWRRLSRESNDNVSEPMVSEYPDLIGRLFILQRAHVNDYPFRVAGANLQDIFGRELAEHNFLSLWRPADKPLISGAIESALMEGSPSLLTAEGESLDGRKVNVEVSFAPLDAPSSPRPRILGLYQLLEEERRLHGRPIWRQYAKSVLAAKPASRTPGVRLIASNDV